MILSYIVSFYNFNQYLCIIMIMSIKVCIDRKRYRMMLLLWWITIFWSQRRWFIKDFRSWLRQSWKSLANHLTCDQNIVIHRHECIIIFLIRYVLFGTHKSVNNIIDRSFRNFVAKEGLFWLSIVTSSEHEVLALWRHIRRLFMRAQIDAKVIFTSE